MIRFAFGYFEGLQPPAGFYSLEYSSDIRLVGATQDAPHTSRSIFLNDPTEIVTKVLSHFRKDGVCKKALKGQFMNKEKQGRRPWQIHFRG